MTYATQPEGGGDRSGAARRESGAPAPFVVGVARSGTTLVRLMLDAHPALAIPPETHFAHRVIDACAGTRGSRERAIDAIVASPFWGDFGISAETLRHAARASAGAGPGPVLRAFYELYAERQGKARWGDKTPPYLEGMEPIQRALPEARFVHVVRDGRDVALSAIPLWFGPSDIADAARQWASRIAAARRQASALEGYLELRYEDLVRDPPAVLARVCDFLELRWDPAMLDYHRRAGARLEESANDLRWRDGRTIPAATRTAIHELTGRPPLASRIGRWRTEMDPGDRRSFARIAGDVLEALHYPLD